MENCKINNCQKRLLVSALKAVICDIREYERVNNLVPNPGRSECWDSVADAVKLLRDLDAQ